ncbi:MAG: hypothetical protein QOG43_1895 [Actinomycetota bacterium]|jgi:hypothetical protein|nr:hypothetical protein [Actinomycetota bacterium]
MAGDALHGSTAPAVRLAIVVPTRNRADLAIRAVESVLAQRTPAIEIVVSDNSSDPVERDRLAAGLPAGVAILTPPGDLAMTDHWNWALDRAEELLRPTHVTFLTDRMVYKRGVLAPLVRQVALRPESLLVFNHDGVLDDRRPVHVDLEPCSWRVSTISSQLFLDEVATGRAWQWITPRMLNSVAPVALLHTLRQSFGTVFGSVAPDFSFGFRVAATIDQFHAWDAPLLVHYALPRSNGHSQQTGASSADGEDFKRRLNEFRNATPFPDVHTLSTAMFHEYAVVGKECGSPKFRPLHPDVVARAIRRDAKLLVSDDTRRAVLDAIGDTGVTRSSPISIVGRIWRAIPYRSTLYGRRALARVPTGRLPSIVRERAALVPYLGFESTDAALEVAIRTNRVRPRTPLPRAAVGSNGAPAYLA